MSKIEQYIDECDLPTLARTIRMLERLPKADIIWIKEWLNTGGINMENIKCKKPLKHRPSMEGVISCKRCECEEKAGEEE